MNQSDRQWSVGVYTSQGCGFVPCPSFEHARFEADRIRECGIRAVIGYTDPEDGGWWPVEEKPEWN